MKKLLILSLVIALPSFAQDTSSAFSDAVDLGNGQYSNWIGTFAPEGGILSTTGWIEHEEHGRLYVSANGQFVFLYDANLDATSEGFTGWLFTSRTTHPFFYAFGDNALWATYMDGVEGPSPTPRVFFNIAAKTPFLLPKYDSRNIIELATDAGSFTSLAAALTRADLVTTLQGPGPFTVFAPTDTAFGQLDPDTLNALLTDDSLLPTLAEILTYHVVPGRLSAEDLGLDTMDWFSGESKTLYLTTVAGSDVRIDVTPFGVFLDNGAMVSTADLNTSNGVIHVLDTVLMPPADLVTTAVDGGLNSLATALTEANLVETIRTGGPFTVFAPIDSAFAALGTETLNTLFDDANIAQLQDILTYHVVEGVVYASEVPTGSTTMLNGDTAEITVTAEGTLQINGANIIQTDIRGSNGVVHLIDTVITPPDE